MEKVIATKKKEHVGVTNPQLYRLRRVVIMFTDLL